MAEHGIGALKIDTLANLVGKSRSSFYHLFGDMDGFHDALIEFDLDLTRQFRDDTEYIEDFFPEYAEVMVKYKHMLFFNKHVFLNRSINEKYAETWEKIAELTDDKTEVLWMKLVNLPALPTHEREQFYIIIRTSAFMRLQFSTFSYKNIYKTVADVNSSFGFLLGDHQIS